MLDEVKNRLTSMNYTVKASDEPLLAFSIDKVTRFICNDCNVEEIPEGLKPIAIDMVVGEFLLAKKTYYPQDLEGFDLTGVVKQIQAGDTNVTFADSSNDDSILTAYIDYLLNHGKDQFSCFRKIRW